MGKANIVGARDGPPDSDTRAAGPNAARPVRSLHELVEGCGGGARADGAPDQVAERGKGSAPRWVASSTSASSTGPGLPACLAQHTARSSQRRVAEVRENSAVAVEASKSGAREGANARPGRSPRLPRIRGPTCDRQFAGGCLDGRGCGCGRGGKCLRLQRPAGMSLHTVADHMHVVAGLLPGLGAPASALGSWCCGHSARAGPRSASCARRFTSCP
jgi:hypothetical protein